MKKFFICLTLLFIVTACETPKPASSSSATEVTILPSSPPEVLVEPSLEKITDKNTVIPQNRGNTAGNILNWGIAAYSEGYIYYINPTDHNTIYKMPENGGQKTKLNDHKSAYINVADGWVFFCDQDDGWKMYKMRTDGSDGKCLTDHRSYDIQLVGDTVYFLNGNIYAYQGGSACAIQSDGTQERQLTDNICQDLNINGDNIYYANWSDDGSVYKMQRDGSQNQKLNDDQCIDLNVLNGWIYYRNDKGVRGLYKMKTDGSGRTLLYKGSVYCLNVSDTYIYFCNWESKKKYPGPIYRISVDGGEPLLLNKAERCSDVSLIPGWIYHFVLGKNDTIFRMRPDGSERQKVE